MRVLLTVTAAMVAAYVGLALYVYFFQARLIYLPELPSRQVDATPAQAGLNFEAVSIPTGDHETLDGWFVPAGGAALTLLYFHGNGGNIGHRIEIIKRFHDLGLNVFIFDYRGYGRSSGSPSEAGTYADALAAWNHLTVRRGIPAQAILLYGESLGSAVAAWLAARHTPRGLAIYAAFTSIPDMARHLYPFLPSRLIARFRYDTRKELAQVSCPILILHSEEDEMIPFSHAKALSAAAAGTVSLVPLKGGHNEAPFVSRVAFDQGIRAFLASIAAGGQRGGSP